MNTLNSFSAKTIQIDEKLIPHSLNHRPLSFKPFSSLCFRTPFFPSFVPIRASSSPSSSFPLKNPETPKSINPLNPNNQPLSSFSFSILFSFLKPTVIATITATALLLTRFYFSPKPAVAVSSSSALTTEANTKDSVDPSNVESLKKLMEDQIKDRKVADATRTIDKLIELEPNETEWPLLKSHLYALNGELQSAKIGFNEILEKDPFSVKAYHGLVVVASQEDFTALKEIKKMVKEGMKMCEKENKKSELKDFKLLLAQIWVMEDKYDGALEFYDELLKEDPKDFRIYLFKGILHTLLDKKDEADKCFKEYQKLVPQGHPSARAFDENLIAAQLFAQNVVSERSESNS